MFWTLNTLFKPVLQIPSYCFLINNFGENVLVFSQAFLTKTYIISLACKVHPRLLPWDHCHKDYTPRVRSRKEHTTAASNIFSIFNEVLLAHLGSRLCASDKLHSSTSYLFLSDQSFEENSLFSSVSWSNVYLSSLSKCMRCNFFNWGCEV